MRLIKVPRILIETYCSQGSPKIRATVSIYRRGIIYDEVGQIKVDLVVKGPCLALGKFI